MASTIDTITMDGDEEIDIRGWIRTFADSGKPIYVGIYTSFRHQDRGYVSVGFPIPSANFTATLLPSNAGEHDFVLASRTELEFPGHYLSSVDSERDALTSSQAALFPGTDLRLCRRRRTENRPQLLPGRPAVPDSPLRDRTTHRSAPVTPKHSIGKRRPENGRCPARTGDLLLVRREHVLRSAAVCRFQGASARASASPRVLGKRQCAHNVRVCSRVVRSGRFVAPAQTTASMRMRN